MVGDFEDLCGIMYYTHRRTEMLDESPADLLWGYRRGDARDLFRTPEQFHREWNSSARVFVLSDRGFDLRDAVVLAESPREVLRTNQPEPTVGSETLSSVAASVAHV